MGTKTSITVQSLGKIAQCCRCENVVFVFYRQDAVKRQTAGIKFTQGKRSGFSPGRGDSLHRFKSNLAGPTGTRVRLAVQNFASIAKGSGNAAPKI